MEFRVRANVRNKGAHFKPLPESQLHCEFGEQEGLLQGPGLDRVGQADIPTPVFRPESNSSCQSCSGRLCSAVEWPFIGN